MIVESIVAIIFIISAGGIIFILAKKMPAVSSLPQNGTTGIRQHQIVSRTEDKIKDFIVFFKKQMFLHKFLSWVKIMALKVETIVDKRLHRIRKKAQQIDKEIKIEK